MTGDPVQSEARARAVLGIAREYLRRWRDQWTRNQREDLAQETAIRFWCQSPRLARPGALRGYVRTIARRCRCRGLLRHLREVQRTIQADECVGRSATSARATGPQVFVGGRLVPVAVLREEIGPAIAALPTLNGHLVRAFYEGFSVAELSARYELSEDCVKKRIHRSRARLRKMLEERVSLPASAGRALGWMEQEGEIR